MQRFTQEQLELLTLGQKNTKTAALRMRWTFKDGSEHTFELGNYHHYVWLIQQFGFPVDILVTEYTKNKDDKTELISHAHYKTISVSQHPTAA